MPASPDSPGPLRPGPGPGSVAAAAAAVGSFLLLRRLLAPWGLVGTAAAEWIGLAGVPVAWALGRGSSPGLLLRTGPAAGAASGLRGWGAALLVGCAGIPVAWTVTWLQGDWIRPEPVVVESLRIQLLAGSPAQLLLLVLTAGLTPAVCEELVFRGALLGALLRRWRPRAAILASGLAFGLLHWVPGGEFRVLPTAAVGAILGWLAWRSGSAVPAMAAHGVHNVLVLTSAMWAAERGWSPVWGIRGDEALPPPLWLALAGVAILGLARRLLRGTAAPAAADREPSTSPSPVPDEP